MPKLDQEVIWFHILDKMPVDVPMGYRDIILLLKSNVPISTISMVVLNNRTRFLFEETPFDHGTRTLVTRKF